VGLTGRKQSYRRISSIHGQKTGRKCQWRVLDQKQASGKTRPFSFDETQKWSQPKEYGKRHQTAVDRAYAT